MINGTQSELNFSNKRFTIAFLLAVLLSFEIISHANLTWDDKMMLRSANLAYYVSFFLQKGIKYIQFMWNSMKMTEYYSLITT